MLTISVEDIDLRDVKILAMDGDAVTSELICHRCSSGPSRCTDDMVTSTTSSDDRHRVLHMHRDVFMQRGWRRVDGVVCCPNCMLACA